MSLELSGKCSNVHKCAQMCTNTHFRCTSEAIGWNLPDLQSTFCRNELSERRCTEGAPKCTILANPCGLPYQDSQFLQEVQESSGKSIKTCRSVLIRLAGQPILTGIPKSAQKVHFWCQKSPPIRAVEDPLGNLMGLRRMCRI